MPDETETKDATTTNAGAGDDKGDKGDKGDKAKSQDTPNTKKEDDGDETDGMTPEQLKKHIKGLRSEIASKRDSSNKSKEEARAAKEELALLKKKEEDAELEKKKKNGEWEKIATEKDEALNKANERTKRAELKLFAQKEGILDPSDVSSLPLDKLTIDDDGEVQGAEKLIKDLKASKPHWFKAPEEKKEEKVTGTSKGKEPGQGKSGPPDFTKMTAKEWEAHKKSRFDDMRARK